MNHYIVRQQSASVAVVEFDEVDAAWEQWFLLSGDRHHDSISCDRGAETKHLNKAKDRGALVLDCGDLFDAMQGRFDPRRNLDEVRQEDAGVNYYDRIVDHALEFYSQYAENWLIQGKGNHESAVLKNTNHDLLTAFIRGMRQAGSNAVLGGYGGWVKVKLKCNKTKTGAVNIKYFHGAGGGGGPVTRGVIQTNRQSVYLPDADVVLNGHTHDAWIVPIARERLNDMGNLRRDLCWYVRTPGYKNEYGEGSEGWAVEKWLPPKPTGCVWLRIWIENAKKMEIGQECILEIE